MGNDEEEGGKGSERGLREKGGGRDDVG